MQNTLKVESPMKKNRSIKAILTLNSEDRNLAQTQKQVDTETWMDCAEIFPPALPCWRDPNCSWLHRGLPQSARCHLCRPHGGGCCHACLGNRLNSLG